MTMQQVSMKDMGLFGPILEQAIDGVVVIDHANSVVLFNAAAERVMQEWGVPVLDLAPMARDPCYDLTDGIGAYKLAHACYCMMYSYSFLYHNMSTP